MADNLLYYGDNLDMVYSIVKTVLGGHHGLPEWEHEQQRTCCPVWDFAVNRIIPTQGK